MFIKKFTLFFLSLFIFASAQIVEGQTENTKDKKPVITIDEAQFYDKEMLQGDYKDVDAVVYVNIKERKLVDSIGDGDCETDKGAGYCLYLLKADVIEVFKGEITGKTIEFYTSPDMDYPKKYLIGKRVVFMNKSDNYPDKKMSFGTMENSTRWIKYDILKKMRRIAKKKN